MQQMEITMLGKRSVGKTSLLTVMYDRFDAEIGQVKLQLIPERATRNRLADRLAQLKALVEKKDSLIAGQGIQPGTEALAYSFFLARNGVAKERANLELIFHDFPGGFLQEGTNAQQEFVEKLAERCPAILIPIHTPALMEEDGRWSELANSPLRVTAILRERLNEETVVQTKKDRLVVLSPVKCEKYLDKEQDRERLLAAVRREYASLLRHLATDSLRSHIAVVIAPVQTVGSVIFHRIEKKITDGKKLKPIFHFRRRDFNAIYDPRDSEQILRYLLRFALSQYLNNRGWFDKLGDWIFGWDHAFREAVQKFAKGSREDLPFCVVQGHELLSLP